MNPPITKINSSVTIQQSLRSIAAQLAGQSETTSLDTQTLLAHITGQSRAWLLSHPEAILSPHQEKTLSQAISRLEKGNPLPYVIGHWEFFGLDFIVTPDTLIPRPETELLVEQAISWLKDHPGLRKAADIGTGSGCIAVSLAVNIPDINLTAIDISPTALEIARANAQKHQVAERIDFFQADLLVPDLRHASTFDLVCANLPYIPTENLSQLEVYRREPTLALDGGADGLSLIRRFLPQAAQCLVSRGLLLLEIEATQGQSAIKLAREHFPDSEITRLKDLAGHDRLIRIRT